MDKIHSLKRVWYKEELDKELSKITARSEGVKRSLDKLKSNFDRIYSAAQHTVKKKKIGRMIPVHAEAVRSIKSAVEHDLAKSIFRMMKIKNIIWYGSVNYLSFGIHFGTREESAMRFDTNHFF